MDHQKHEELRRLLKILDQVCVRDRDIFLTGLSCNLKATALNWVFSKGVALP